MPSSLIYTCANYTVFELVWAPTDSRIVGSMASSPIADSESSFIWWKCRHFVVFAKISFGFKCVHRWLGDFLRTYTYSISYMSFAVIKLKFSLESTCGTIKTTGSSSRWLKAALKREVAGSSPVSPTVSRLLAWQRPGLKKLRTVDAHRPLLSLPLLYIIFWPISSPILTSLTGVRWAKIPTEWNSEKWLREHLAWKLVDLFSAEKKEFYYADFANSEHPYQVFTVDASRKCERFDQQDYRTFM